jgi:hypothetical protein
MVLRLFPTHEGIDQPKVGSDCDTVVPVGEIEVVARTAMTDTGLGHPGLR